MVFLFQTGLRAGGIADKLVKVESLKTALEEANTQIASLKERLIVSDTQAQRAVEAKSVAELEAEKHKAELERLQSSMKAYEDNLAEREALVAKGKQAIDDGQKDLNAKTEQFRVEMRDWLLKFWRDQKSSYQRQGAFRSRVNFLTSPVGQEFLRIMHRDLLAEFVQTEEFAKAAGKGFGILMAEAIDGACRQMEVTLEQRGKLDTKQILAQMNLDRVNAGLGIQPNKPADWWIPVMEKAAQVLLERGDDDPDLPKKCLYELPYLGTLTESRFEEIARVRVDPVGSDLSEAAIQAINGVCGPEEIPAEETADPLRQQEATSSLRVDTQVLNQNDGGSAAPSQPLGQIDAQIGSSQS